MSILFFTIFYFILSWLRLDYALMFLFFSLPSYQIRFSLFGLPSNLLEIMVLVSFAVWLFKKTELLNYLFKPNRIKRFKNNKLKRVPYPFGMEIVLLLIISFIAVAITGFSDSALGVWKAYFFEPILVFILILNVFQPPLSLPTRQAGLPLAKGEKKNEGMAKIIWPLALSALILSSFAIYQKITGQFIFNPAWAEIGSRRATSLFSYPNALGLYLGPIILVLVGFLSNRISRFKDGQNEKRSFELRIKNYELRISEKFLTVFVSLTVFISLLAIYFAKSEGALIGIIAGLFVFGLLAGKRTRLATIIVSIILGIGILAYQPARDYAFTKITLQDLSGEIRKQQWRETGEMLKDGLVISGTGLANYQIAIAPYHQEGIFFNSDNDPEFHRHVVWNEEYKKSHWQPVEIYLYPHNIFLNFWTELGLAGMLLFVWIFFKYFLISINNFKNSIHFVIAGSDPQSRNLNSAKTWIPDPVPAGRQEVRNDRKEGKVINNKFLNLGLIGAMVVIIIHGLVDVPYFKNDLAIIFWLLVAMISLIETNIRINANNTNKF